MKKKKTEKLSLKDNFLEPGADGLLLERITPARPVFIAMLFVNEL